MNLALLTDGLRAEREQGITIDVAYRSFFTPRRRFLLADAPGHVQYTRNMVTGTSTARLAIVLLDARKGVVEQTRRHTYIASVLGTPHIAAAVNKMDLVGYDEVPFRRDRAGAGRARASRLDTTCARSRLGAERRQRRRALPADVVVTRADAPRAPRDGRDHAGDPVSTSAASRCSG